MSQKIVMNKVLQVYAIKERTTAKMFKTLKTGDKIELYLAIGSTGGYATYIEVKNLTTKEIVRKSNAELSKILACFEFTEIKE